MTDKEPKRNTIIEENMEDIHQLGFEIGRRYALFFIAINVANGLLWLLALNSAWISFWETIVICGTTTAVVFLYITCAKKNIADCLGELDYYTLQEDTTKGLRLVVERHSRQYYNRPKASDIVKCNLIALPLLMVLKVVQRLMGLDDTSVTFIITEVSFILCFVFHAAYNLIKFDQSVDQLKRILTHARQAKVKETMAHGKDAETDVTKNADVTLGENFFVMTFHEKDGEGNFTFCGPLVCRLAEGENQQKINDLNRKLIIASGSEAELIIKELARGKLVLRYNARYSGNYIFAASTKTGIICLLHDESVKKGHEDDE